MRVTPSGVGGWRCSVMSDGHSGRPSRGIEEFGKGSKSGGSAYSNPLLMISVLVLQAGCS